MNRQELKALLHGVENAGDIVDQIMEMNGADIENAKAKANGDYAKLVNENESLRGQIKAYEKGGEKYIDPAELARLQQFEADTVQKEKRTKAETAVREMLEHNKVLPGVIKRELKALNYDEVQLGEDGKVSKDYEKAYMEAFKADSPDAFQKPQEGTGTPAHGDTAASGNSNGTARKQTLAEILQERKNQ